MDDITLRLRNPADLLAVLPYQFGFHLHDSLVCVCLAGGRLRGSQRLDLDDAAALRDQPQARARCERLLERDAEEVVLVAFEGERDRSHSAIATYLAVCLTVGVSVLDVLVVHDGRWRSALDPTGASSPMPRPEEVPAVAGYVRLGAAPLPSRAHLAEGLRPCRGDLGTVARELDVRAGRPRGRQARAEQADGVAAWRELLIGADSGPRHRYPDPSPPVVVAANLGLRHACLRDGLLAWLTPQLVGADLVERVIWRQLVDALGPSPLRPSGPLRSEATGHVERLGDLQDRLVRFVTSTPRRHQAPGLTLLGALLWGRGDGAFADAALTAAAEIEPGQVVTESLHAFVAMGMRPEAIAASPGSAKAAAATGAKTGDDAA